MHPDNLAEVGSERTSYGRVPISKPDPPALQSQAFASAVRREHVEGLVQAAKPLTSSAKPPALPERIEAVLQLLEYGHEVIGSP